MESKEVLIRSLRQLLKRNPGLQFFIESDNFKIGENLLYKWNETFYNWEIVKLHMLEISDLNSLIYTIKKEGR